MASPRLINSCISRHPREGEGPGQADRAREPWIPAFAGMTPNLLKKMELFWLDRAITSRDASDRSHNHGDRCHPNVDRGHTDGDGRLPRPVGLSRTGSGRYSG